MRMVGEKPIDELPLTICVLGFLALAAAVGCNGTAESSTADATRSIDADLDTTLGSTSEAERRAAAQRLASHGGLAEAEMARALAETDDNEVKQQMIEGLVAARAYDSLPVILDALEDSSSKVRSKASEALIAMLNIRVRYDADAPESERAEAAQRYRDHWDRLNETGLIEFQKDPEKAEQHFRGSTTFSRPKNEVGSGK